MRTAFIVGFPGETEACFEALLDFIRETRFERLGVFTYSREEGTRAGKMGGQVPEKIKQKRRNLALAAQRKIAAQVAESFVGRTIKVLIEGSANLAELRRTHTNPREYASARRKLRLAGKPAGRFLMARSEADAPGIDGRVYIQGQLPVGAFAWVKIIDHMDYDLIAEPD